ncbi:MAG TPA: YlxR family protein [Anaeromyxobacteraceae bacterium]|nr:YlxR family protein [Anaeromyxobacteraceae bacterium]
MAEASAAKARAAGGGGRPSERTCVGCGARAAPEDLLRLRLVEGRVTFDRERTGGRGAWLHADPACLSRAVRRKGFARAFRGAVSVDEELLRRQLTGNAGKD